MNDVVGSYTVDWGNGVTGSTNSYIYSSSGNYTIVVSGFTSMTSFGDDEWFNPQFLITATFIGNVINNFSGGFDGCTNLINVEIDDTSAVTNMHSMFVGAASFNQPLNWDTSAVADMSRLFGGALSFNQPLNWDTSKVTDMSSMFYGALAFNQPLNWDTSKVVNMSFMFYGAWAFNQPLNWDTSKVVNMSFMFFGCIYFNQILTPNENIWNISNVTDMSFMFAGTVSLINKQPWNINPQTNTPNMYLYSGVFSGNGNAYQYTTIFSAITTTRNTLKFNGNVNLTSSPSTYIIPKNIKVIDGSNYTIYVNSSTPNKAILFVSSGKPIKVKNLNIVYMKSLSNSKNRNKVYVFGKKSSKLVFIKCSANGNIRFTGSHSRNIKFINTTYHGNAGNGFAGSKSNNISINYSLLSGRVKKHSNGLAIGEKSSDIVIYDSAINIHGNGKVYGYGSNDVLIQ